MSKLRYAILLLVLIALQTRADAVLLCQNDLPEFDGRRVAWFNLNVDDSYNRQSSDVFLRINGFDAKWIVDADEAFAPDSLMYFRYDLPVSDGAILPLSVTVVADGKPSKAREASRLVQNVQLLPDRSTRTVNAATILKDDVPNLFGLHTVQISAVDHDGRKVSDETLALPDWAVFKLQVRAAGHSAEMKRRRHDCGPGAVF